MSTAPRRTTISVKGIKVATLLPPSSLPVDLVPQLWKGRFRGQKQKWFTFRFLGTDRDIDIATEHPEFSSWRWADLKELPDLIVPFKRKLYEDLIAEFAPLIGR